MPASPTTIDRRKAALELLATFDPEDFPTPERVRELVTLWSTPPPPPPPKPKKKR